MGCPLLPLLLPTAVSTLGGLVFGYELGIISGALIQLQDQFSFTCVQQEALVSSLLFGAVFASVIGGWLIDRHGRRTSILLSDVLIVGGSLILTFSSSFVLLLIGRLFVGFAMSLSSMSCCIFVSEMVSSSRRGLMVTLYESGITVGILMAYGVNYMFSGVQEGWRYMFGFAVAPCLAQFASVWVLSVNNATVESQSQKKEQVQTEKAQYTVLEEDDRDEAKVKGYTMLEEEVKNKTYMFQEEEEEEEEEEGEERQKKGYMIPEEEGKDNKTEVLMKGCMIMEEEVKKKGYIILHLIQNKHNMRIRTIIGLGLVLFQQFSGQPNILFYASTVFCSVGFRNRASAMLASVGLGVVKVLSSFVAMLCADKLGRRPLLISGCSLMAVGLIFMGILSRNSLSDMTANCGSEFHPNNTELNESAVEPVEIRNESISAGYSEMMNWIILILMMSVVSAFAVGFGPMTWLVLSEIFPAEVRGRAFAFINCFNWMANLIVTFSFLSVIETKGKSLHDIDKELSERRFPHREECCCIFQRSFTPGYRRVSWTNETI
ncbi:solute carrier family 2, facilitated glucose transporter member 10 isoform X2 [Hoplias malabaricus]|uniref:solute carrier family 2, facilitated glucose transporter member 10 isoform X2 n=1 Tax=Hoplias malabaricus TaxID=27720 RepID=UPI003461AEFB